MYFKESVINHVPQRAASEDPAPSSRPGRVSQHQAGWHAQARRAFPVIHKAGWEVEVFRKDKH